ncbi:uncharacterized protein DMAD_13068 [Drosophila madeirensis]|uniref:Uncharacterized protein n=1 Tax=Drosophila madeirensis TaxID=30013 RepID=A0AAU9FIL3_DROMD
MASIAAKLTQKLNNRKEKKKQKENQKQEQDKGEIEDPLPVWSRLLKHNADGHRRNDSFETAQYQVEISNRL